MSLFESVYYRSGYHIGSKQIVGLMHAHGLSAVYEVEDAEGQHFALKVHHHTEELPMEQRRRNAARLQREWEVLYTFRGLPCFPQVYDFRFHDGDALLLMELLKGKTFDRFVAEQPRLLHAVGAFKGMCAAVAALHDQGICHRDLKPSNFFITDDNRAVLLDLGSSQVMSLPTITGRDDVIGTAQYLSPEYAAYLFGRRRRHHVMTPAEDVYALGVVLYWLLTGRKPFTVGADALSVFELLQDVQVRKPIHPCKMEPPVSVPRALGDLAMRMLDKEPRKRPANGRAVLKAFEGVREEAEAEMWGAVPARADEVNEPSLTLTSGVMAANQDVTEEPAVMPMALLMEEIQRFGRVMFTAVATSFVSVTVAFAMTMVQLHPWTYFAQYRAEKEAQRQQELSQREETSISETTLDAGTEVKEGKAPAAVPSRPLKGQKQAPCGPGQRELHGGCWYVLKECAEAAFTEGGECFSPVPDYKIIRKPVADP